MIPGNIKIKNLKNFFQLKILLRRQKYKVVMNKTRMKKTKSEKPVFI